MPKRETTEEIEINDPKFWLERYIDTLERGTLIYKKLFYLFLGITLIMLGYNVADFVGLFR